MTDPRDFIIRDEKAKARPKLHTLTPQLEQLITAVRPLMAGRTGVYMTGMDMMMPDGTTKPELKGVIPLKYLPIDEAAELANQFKDYLRYNTDEQGQALSSVILRQSSPNSFDCPSILLDEQFAYMLQETRPGRNGDSMMIQGFGKNAMSGPVRQASKHAIEEYKTQPPEGSVRQKPPIPIETPEMPEADKRAVVKFARDMLERLADVATPAKKSLLGYPKVTATYGGVDHPPLTEAVRMTIEKMIPGAKVKVVHKGGESDYTITGPRSMDTQTLNTFVTRIQDIARDKGYSLTHKPYDTEQLEMYLKGYDLKKDEPLAGRVPEVGTGRARS